VLEDNMQRGLIRVVVGLLTVVLGAGLAHADGKKGKGAKEKEAKIANSPAIAESMGELKWGMSKDDLLTKVTDKIKEKYRPLVAKSKSAMDEDRLRTQAKDEMRAARESYVEFTGGSTGWDVSFIKGEFTHNNDESMIVVRDENSQNFYFFFGGRLWKWYKAFDASVFKAGDFQSFAASVQRRFGEATDVHGQMADGAGERHWLEWQDDSTRLRAIDQTSFYGFYCLVFEEKETLKNLARLRTNAPKREEKRHALVEAVTSGDTAQPDDSPNIVDRITGKIRVNEQSEPEAGADRQGSKSARKGTSSSSSSSSSSGSPAGVAADDDPLRGLGL
jgi:hypothetical protein